MDFEEIIENGVRILKTSDTFYNPAQKINRDITILCINEHIKTITTPNIFEAMSATGLRGIRFAKELSPCNIYMNDISPNSIKTIKHNLEHNGIHKSQETNNDHYEYNNSKIHILNSDCNKTMCEMYNKFDVIDIDPFGSSAPYINNALYSIRHNGLLCVTSTDKQVLCSNRNKCFAKYNALIPNGNPAHHEHALRILIGYIQAQAAKYKKKVIPILSVSLDFYVRVFVKVVRCNASKLDISYYFYCKCFNMWKVGNGEVLKCNFCLSAKFKLCGPYYDKNMNNNKFIDNIELNTTDERINVFLNIIKHEVDDFMIYSIPDMASYLKKNCIPLYFLVSALLNMNFEVSLTHTKENAVKTTAKIEDIYFLIYEYAENKDASIFKKHEAAKAILDRRKNRSKIFSKMGPLSMPKKNN